MKVAMAIPRLDVKQATDRAREYEEFRRGDVRDTNPAGRNQARTLTRVPVPALRRLSARRSSSLKPPHTPASCPEASAHWRHSELTGQRRHTAFASAICS